MWITHPADRVNVLRALFAPVILLSPFWCGALDDFICLAAPVIFFVIGKTNYILHLHVHRPFSAKPWLNVVLDLSMGFTTGMTASNWRIQHRYGHHRGIDKPFRAGRQWETTQYSALGALSFCVRSIWPTFWHPLAESFHKGVLRNVRSPINYRWAFIEQSLFILFVLTLFMWIPWLVLAFLVPWYTLIYFISRYVDYLSHAG
jgi:fatty-acid desaturase